MLYEVITMVVSYLMEEDGTLDGIWAYLGDAEFVITSYSIHYTKLYDIVATSEDDLYCQEALNLHAYALAGWDSQQKQAYIRQWGQLWTAHIRITSYNVCYTKLLRH